MNTLTIARAELRRIFLSPLAWAVLAVLQLLLGFVFVNVLFEFITNPYPGEQFGAADVVAGQVFGFATILVLLIMPLMTMRLFAEERKSGTLNLLLSAPVSLTEIVLGKFLGVLGFIVVLLAGPMAGQLAAPLSRFIVQPHAFAVDGSTLLQIAQQLGLLVVAALALPMLVVIVAAIVGNLVQHKPVFTAENMKPKFSKISPLAGLKRIFGPQGMANFLKALAKLTIVSVIAFLVIWPERELLFALIRMELVAVPVVAVWRAVVACPSRRATVSAASARVSGICPRSAKSSPSQGSSR